MDSSKPIAPATSAAVRRKQLLRPILIAVLAVLLNVVVYYLPVDYRSFGNYAYIGVFLITLIANTTTFVPVPYIPVVARIAAQSDDLALVIVAGALGSAIGESVAFFIGRSGRGLIADTPTYRWVDRQLRHPWRAFAALFVLAAPPNPAFDIAGLAAGALGLPYWLFFIAVFLGRIVRVGLIALIGGQL